MTILSNKKPPQSSGSSVTSTNSPSPSILTDNSIVSNKDPAEASPPADNNNNNNNNKKPAASLVALSNETQADASPVSGEQAKKTRSSISPKPDEAATVSIQINDFQAVTGALLRPSGSSSSSSSSPTQNESDRNSSQLLTTKTGPKTTQTNDSSSTKFKKGKTSKKRKLSSASSSPDGGGTVTLFASPSLGLKSSPPKSLKSKLSQHQRAATSTNSDFEAQITQSNNILNLTTKSTNITNISNTTNSDDNNSDSDFDFLNKTDNHSDEDENSDSDLNTQFKQNLINQQIHQQQQLYLRQLQQNEKLNVLQPQTGQNPSRKKLTKKKLKSKANLLTARNTVGIKENVKINNQKENEYEATINSEDEYENRPLARSGLLNISHNTDNNNAFGSESMQNFLINAETIEELESKFCLLMKEKKGFVIKQMKEDGACLFRAVSDQIYGDEDMHSTIRSHCMDYIAKNADYFKQYMTEDVDRYLNRKRQDNCHGNHIEIIAIAEIYNRPIEVYEYSIEPRNTFQSAFETDNDPIRLSYHGRNHYNSVVNPHKATIGVGLGLPQLTPGLAEKNLMNEALKKSEEFHLEKTMMDDKMKATDWEATNEEIMELVARESYLQWLKDNEKRNCPRHSTLNLQQMPTNATCSTWDQPSVSHTTNTLSSSDIRMSPPRHQRYNLPRTNSNHRTSTVTPPHSPSQSKLTHQLKCSPKSKSDTSKSKLAPLTLASSGNNDTTANRILYEDNLSMQAAQSQYQFYEPMNHLGTDMFGLGTNDWLDPQAEGDGDSDILARVLAASQQEYLESLKAKRHNQQT